MKIVSVVGARPQFIKCAPVSRELRNLAREIVVHTGQHYDEVMSDVFFRDLGLRQPDYNLGVGSGSHAWQTAEMMKRIEEVLVETHPDIVVVYGDTNSTMAAALTAVKLKIPVAHVEAGLRSFNCQMPEEINRLVTDHLSSVLLCPTVTAVKNLGQEGITSGVYHIGDVMYDALGDNLEIAKRTSTILDRLGLEPKLYALATVHRAENTDQSENLRNIIDAFLAIADTDMPVVFPVHPRTRKSFDQVGIEGLSRVHLIDPVSYLDMLLLESNARLILTDSGGVQKEACWLSVPFITLRNETEWVETVESGWNRLAGTQAQDILRAMRDVGPGQADHWPWKRGEASKNVAAILSDEVGVSASMGSRYGSNVLPSSAPWC